MDPPQSEKHELPQFSLRTVFAVITGVAVVFGLIHWLGPATIIIAVPLVLAVLLVIAANVAARKQLHVEIIGLAFLGLLTFSCLLSMVLPYFDEDRTSARRAQCINNLKQIGVALHSYAEVYGTFPPPYIVDGDGKPMHCWRVLILPYLEQKALYDQYDFNEPWDGPHNKLLARQAPRCFQCPSDASLRGAPDTSYVAVNGPQTVWPRERGVAFDEISDGTAQTLAVVEIVHSGINWMEPRDLPFSALSLGINPPTGAGVSSEHPGMAQALFCDGTVHALNSTVSVKTLQALATKAGGETIDQDY